MEFSTTNWAAFFIVGASALEGTFGKRLVRIIGLAVMPFAFAGLVLARSRNYPMLQKLVLGLFDWRSVFARLRARMR